MSLKIQAEPVPNGFAFGSENISPNLPHPEKSVVMSRAFLESWQRGSGRVAPRNTPQTLTQTPQIKVMLRGCLKHPPTPKHLPVDSVRTENSREFLF